MKKNSGDSIITSVSNWNFDGDVAKNFDNHIDKSVPLYKETHNLYVNLSDFFLQDKSKIIDLGCSTGTFLNLIYQRHKDNNKQIQYIGLDTIGQMILVAEKKNKNKKIKFIKANFHKYNLSNACIISSFYTIQFVSPKQRQSLIDKIYKSLNWGGAFFFVEKIRANDARFQDYLNQTYIEYKIDKGFTPEEILNKSSSLKGVMEPFSSNANIQLLKRSGFKDILCVFKYASFEGLLAIK
jgi:tRNA (cmo5U34)-methyltransferase